MTDSAGHATPPQHLPPDAPDFLGRRAELQRLDELAAAPGAPVIEVSGPDGVGKSALVAHWARRCAHRFPDGQLWIDCSGAVAGSTADPADLLARTLTELGTPTADLPPGIEERAQLWQSTLHGRQMLIVLDRASGAEQVGPLLARAPGCVTVAISLGDHQPLSVGDGTDVITVPRMSNEDVVLALRGPAATAGVPDGELAALVEHTRGLPLLVRIVAAFLGSASRSDVAALVGALSAAQSPANSLDAVLRAAYAGLPTGAQEMFPMLALCPGPVIDPEAAQAAAGVDGDAAGASIAALVSAGLLTSGPPGPATAHDLIGPFLQQLLAEGDPSAVRKAQARVLQHYLAIADAVLLALEPARVMRLPLPSGMQRLARFDSAADAFVWIVAQASAMVAIARRSLVDGDVFAVSALLERVFWSLWIRGDVGQLRPLLEQAARIAVEVDDPSAEMTLANMIGLDSARRGDLDGATTWLSRSAGAASRADNLVGLSGTLLNLATMDRLSGRTREAIAAYEEAVQIKQAAGDGDILLGLSSLISTYLELGDVDAAGRVAQTARNIVEAPVDAHVDADADVDAGVPHPRLGRIRYHVAEVAFARHEFDAVLQHLDVAEPASRARADFDNIAQILTLRAVVLAERGDHAAAQELIDQAGEIALRDDESDLGVTVLAARGRIQTVAGQYGDACTQLSAAVQLARKLGLRFNEADSLYRLALARRAAGDRAEAAATARQAMEVADECEFGRLVEDCNALLTELTG